MNKFKISKEIKNVKLYVQYILLVIFGFIWCGCETSVDASDLLDNPQLVVINGYLSPQDTELKVQISRSKSRASNTPENVRDLVIKNATVVIRNENDDEVSLIYNEDILSYVAPATELPILAGQKYFLNVIAEGKEYKASCTIPINMVQEIQQKITDETDPFAFGNQKLRLEIEDIKDQKNFYIVGAQFTENPDINPDGFTTKVDFEFEQFVTDSNRENGIIKADGFFSFSEIPPGTRLNIQVANAERELYEALRATFLNDYNEDDPFFEPVIGLTNIEGENGFGVFAGYQLTIKEVIF